MEDSKQGSDLCGFIYVLTNPSIPNYVKIGQTERHPLSRALELSDHTGIPVPFEVAFYTEVTDRIRAEQKIHSELASYRVSEDREFFNIPLNLVEEVFRKVLSPFFPLNSKFRIFDVKPTSEENLTENKSMPDFCLRCKGRLIRDTVNNYFLCKECGTIHAAQFTLKS